MLADRPGRKKVGGAILTAAMRGDPNTRQVAIAGFAALVLAGCAYEEPPISWEGEIIRFGADDPEAVCGDSLEWMDARAVALAETFSAAGAEVYPQVDFYWVPESWWEQDACSAETAHACTVDNVIHSLSVPQEHELVHALRRKKLPRVFEEGLATLYGDLGFTPVPSPRERLQVMLEDDWDSTHEDYARAGHFVGFLVERYGLDPLLEMGEYAGFDASWSKTQSAFAAAYGFSLQDALVEYEEYPECSPLNWMNVDIACMQEPVVIDPPHGSGEVVFSQQIACGEPDVRGPLWGSMFTETTIELTNQFDSGMFVRLLGDENSEAKIVLSGCGGCPDAAWVWLGDGVPERFLHLPAGRYVLRMFRPIDDPGESGVSFSYFE